MRWGEIVEAQSGANVVPDEVREKIVSAMIHHIVKDEYWDHHAIKTYPHKGLNHSPEYGEDMADTWGVDRDHESFADHARQWSEARFNEVIEKINAVALVNGRYHLRRMMFVPDYVLVSWGIFNDLPSKQNISLGLYWTFDYDTWEEEVGAYSIWAEKKHQIGCDILIDAMVVPSSIDWETTIKANMDWFSGDREQEMRLYSNAPIAVTTIAVVDQGDSKKVKTGDKLNISGKRFVG